MRSIQIWRMCKGFPGGLDMQYKREKPRTITKFIMSLWILVPVSTSQRVYLYLSYLMLQALLKLHSLPPMSPTLIEFFAPMTLLTSTPYRIIYYLLYFLPVFALDFSCSRTAVWVTSHNMYHVECYSTTISIFNWNILIVIMTAKREHYECISELFFGDHMKCVLKTFNIWIRGGGLWNFMSWK